MTLPMVTCPLCCRPGFSTSDSLCAALVGVTTRKLCCPICNEIVQGLDKFTIHLFGHSLKKFGLNNFKDPLQASESVQSTQICNNKNSKSSNNNNNNNANSSHKALVIEEPSKTKPLNNNLLKFPNSVNEGSPIKPSDKSDWIVNNNNTHIQIENSKNILNSQENPLIYFRTDNGQIFAFTQENVGPNLKNVTINTQNYITNTNITTSTVQTNVIEKIQKRKYNQIFEKDMSEICEKGFQIIQEESETCLSKAAVGPSSPLKSDISGNHVKKMITQEFESCRDLLTKGDFSTSTEDLMDTSVSKESLEEPESSNENTAVDNDQKKSEIKSKEGCRCDICPFIFPNKTILAMHKQLIHKKVEVETENKRKLFLCNICPKSFKMRGSLMLHRRVAHSGGFGNSENMESSKQPPPKPACQVCGKFFKKEIHLSQHMKAHDEKQWQCTICAKTFTTKYFLKKHRRLHTGEMPYRCTTCSKAFTFQQSYHKHLQYHNDEKPYCCAQCGRLFKELSTLHNHERIHSGEKPFTCETCGKAFRQRVSYLVHRRIHTGAMPYKCTSCNKSFRYKVSERTHKCTAQPPGVVVRTQAHLVERLQAAMTKAAENNEKKPCSSDISQTSPHKSPLSVEKDEVLPSPKTATPENNMLSVPDIPTQEVTVKDKTQIYLIVKGPNNESYYQPVMVPKPFKHNDTKETVFPSFTNQNNIPEVSSVKSSDGGSPDESSVQNDVETTNLEEDEGNNSNSKNHNSCLNSPRSNHSSPPNSHCSSMLNSPSVSSPHANSDFFYKFLNSPRDKVDGVSDNEILSLMGESSESSKCSTPNSIESMSLKRGANSNLYRSSKHMSIKSSRTPGRVESFSNYSEVMKTNVKGDQNSDFERKGSELKKGFTPPPVDVMMDSTDLFSLILSPTLSSPSDRFGKMTLSPNSNPSTSWNICSFDKQNLLSDNLSTDIDMAHDPLFENISDDALKEFLFGSESTK